MSKPAPRSNFMQTLLLAVAVFLLINMFLGNKGTPDPRTSDQILAEMKALSGKVEDPGQLGNVSGAIQAEHSKLETKVRDELEAKTILIDTELKAGKIRPDEAESRKRSDTSQAEEKRLAGIVLTGETMHRAGTLLVDLGPLTQAYYLLHDQRTSFGNTWENKSVEVAPTKRFPVTSLTGKVLYDRLVLELRQQSENHLIVGLLPGYRIIDTLVAFTGKNPYLSYAFAAFLLALIVRSMIWPLAQRQYMWGRQMSRLQPLVAELKERYKDKKTGQMKDMQEFNQKVMGLYKEYGINPMSGCLPALIQIPYFILIYQCMLQFRFDFQEGFFLWINPSTSASTNGFVAPNLGEKDYILIVIYAVSMIVTTVLTPVSDPSNQKQQRLMGIGIAVFFSITMFFYTLPSAFVLYWVFTNVFATLQMLRAYRMPLPPLVKVNAPGGGVFPTDGGAKKTNGQITGTGIPVKHKPKKKK